MEFTPVLGIIAACLTTAAFVPQALKTIRTRSTEGLSISTYLLFFSGTICWLIYGLLINNLPVILANAISALLAGIILYLLLTLRKK